MEQNISHMADMGIDPAVARRALQAHGNRLEDAVNAIYSKQTASVHLDDELKTTLASYKPGEHTASYGAGDHTETHVCLSDLDESMEEDDTPARNTHRAPGAPGVLLPDEFGRADGYLAAFLMILHQVAPFTDIVLQHEFFNYGYAPDWWRGQKCLEAGQPTQEIQRLMAFLSPESHRAFASTQGLVDSARHVLFSEDYNSISDFVLKVYDALREMFGSANSDLRAPLVQMFNTGIASPLFPGEHFYQLFTIEPSAYDTDVYRVMHRIMWEKDYSNVGKSRFTKLGDVLTFVFDSSGENVGSGGYVISRQFYPQIYMEGYDDLVKAKVDRMRQLRVEASKLTGEMLRLRSFKGKKVMGMFETAIGHLKTNDSDSYGSAVTELSSIQSHIKDVSLKDTEQLEKIGKERGSIDIFDVEAILGDKKKELEPWLLTGIVINPRQFCYLSKDGSDTWDCFFYEGEGGSTDYERERMGFDEVTRQVRMHSNTNFDGGMILFYTRKSVFEAEPKVALNKGLREFIEKDNEEVEKEEKLQVESGEDQGGQITLESGDDTE